MLALCPTPLDHTLNSDTSGLSVNTQGQADIVCGCMYSREDLYAGCLRMCNVHAVEIFEKSRYRSLPILNRIPLLIGPLFKVSNRYIKTISF